MRRVMLLAIQAGATALLTSCAGAPSPAPAAVELTRLGEAVQMAGSTTSVQECEYVTDLPTPSSDGVDEITRLRNQAGTSGVNTVLLVRRGGTITRAEGYLCAD